VHSPIRGCNTDTIQRFPTGVSIVGNEPGGERKCEQAFQGSGRRPAEKTAKQPFKAYPIGYFRIDVTEVRTEEGKQHLFVAVDRTSKFAFAQLHEAANVHTATAFLTALSMRFRTRFTLCSPTTVCSLATCHRADQARPLAICREHAIEHRLTKPNHPWTTAKSNE
jgi:hypothetical protein